jgi:hypothetical protein
MPTHALILQAVASSPSDVVAEREALESIVREVNRLQSHSGVRLELWRWETHSRPGFGTDAQSVINSQIPADYDIFIGILWTRFGSPTGRAASGTEEEFNDAYARFEANRDSVAILLYFKEAPPELSSIDLDQLGKVRDFKTRVEQSGGLYRTFRTIDEFQSLLRIHLSEEVSAVARREMSSEEEVDQPSDNRARESDDGDVDDDLGFVDYLETATERFSEATDSITNLTDALQSLGQRVEARSQEFPESGFEDVASAKRVARRIGEEMEQFVARAQVEIPIMGNATQEAIEAFGRAASFASEAGPSACEGLTAATTSVRDLKGNMESALQSFQTVRATIAGLPRVQKHFNSAKRRTVATFDALIEQLREGANLALNTYESMERMRQALNCPGPISNE